MSFEERVNEMLDRVLKEKETFNKEWGEKRRNIVVPLIIKAESLLGKRLAGAKQEPKSGTITLYAWYSSVDNFLRFSGNEDQLQVEYSLGSFPVGTTPEPAPTEATFLSLAEITEESVERIILDFATLAARGGRRIKPV